MSESSVKKTVSKCAQSNVTESQTSSSKFGKQDGSGKTGLVKPKEQTLLKNDKQNIKCVGKSDKSEEQRPSKTGTIQHVSLPKLLTACKPKEQRQPKIGKQVTRGTEKSGLEEPNERKQNKNIVPFIFSSNASLCPKQPKFQDFEIQFTEPVKIPDYIRTYAEVAQPGSDVKGGQSSITIVSDKALKSDDKDANNIDEPSAMIPPNDFSTCKVSSCSTSSSDSSSGSSISSESEIKLPKYSISLHNKVSDLRNIIATLAFSDIKACDATVPPGASRTHGKQEMVMNNADSVRSKGDNGRRGTKRKERDIAVFQKSLCNVGDSLSRPHLAVSTIEKLESTLQMILNLGFKITSGIGHSFGLQKAPNPINNAITDIKVFLEPIKSHIASAVQDEYFRPFMDSVDETISPLYNHLNDAKIVLESPVAPLYYLELNTGNSPDLGPDEAVNDAQENLVGDMNADYTSRPQMYRSDLKSELVDIRYSSDLRAASILKDGIIKISFNYGIQIFITVDFGVLVANRPDRLVAAFAANGFSAGLQYFFGECFQTGTFIDASVYNEFHGLEKRARISARGITFADQQSASTYMLTNVSVTTCPPIWSANIDDDFMKRIITGGSKGGQQLKQKCRELLQTSRVNYLADGAIVWIINNLMIRQSADGKLVVHKNETQYTLVISPRHVGKEGELIYAGRLTTPGMHATCSVATKGGVLKHHFFVRQGEKKVYSSDEKFVVRYNTKCAGIKDHKICLSEL